MSVDCRKIPDLLWLEWDELPANPIITEEIKCKIADLHYISVPDEEDQSVTPFDPESLNIIWRISRAYFNWKWTAKWVITNNHLYKEVDSFYRWRGYWYALLAEYINAWFSVPNEEYSTEISVIKLMSKFWFRIFSWILNGDEKILEESITISEIEKLLLERWVIKLVRE